jgi:hypothetical protein
MSETEHDRKQRVAATSAYIYHSLLAGARRCTRQMNPCLIRLAARACNGGREIESLGRLGGAGIVARVGEIAGAACAVGDFQHCCGGKWCN